MTRTVYGVVRKDIALEHVIGLFLKNKNQAPVAPTAYVLLKIAVFLLLFSDSYPEYAVVNEAVSAAAKKEKPFVNAVLRQLLRRKQEVRDRLATATNLSLKYAIAPRPAGQPAAASTPPEKPTWNTWTANLSFTCVSIPGQMTMDQARQTLAAAGIPCRELPATGLF